MRRNNRNAELSLEQLAKLIPQVFLFIVLFTILLTFYSFLIAPKIDDQRMTDFYRVAVELENLTYGESMHVPIASKEMFIKAYGYFTNEIESGVPSPCLNQVQEGSCLCLFTDKKSAERDEGAVACKAYKDRSVRTSTVIFEAKGDYVPIIEGQGLKDMIYVTIDSKK
ncbi:hypothetical protein K9M79_02755 [Candidatus Woesearchaeota archaeon]|nr:hypothetical protein [Candidatus Woesearchaeota archaeon]